MPSKILLRGNNVDMDGPGQERMNKRTMCTVPKQACLSLEICCEDPTQAAEGRVCGRSSQLLQPHPAGVGPSEGCQDV